MWATVIGRAKECGEVKADTDVVRAAGMFHQVFLGASYEQAFLNGLDIDSLSDNFSYLYSLLKT